MALQTENTVGLPLARKERNSGEIVINVLIFCVVEQNQNMEYARRDAWPGFSTFYRFFGIFTVFLALFRA